MRLPDDACRRGRRSGGKVGDLRYGLRDALYPSGRQYGTMMERAIIGFIDYCHCQIRSNVTPQGRLPPGPLLCHAVWVIGAERAQWRKSPFTLAPP
jgi:hypothetical protein